MSYYSILVAQREFKIYPHKLAAGIVKRFGEKEAVKALKVAVSEEMSTRDFSSYLSDLRKKLSGDSGEGGTDNYLFTKKRIPKINRSFQTKWSKARNGDKQARSAVQKGN